MEYILNTPGLQETEYLEWKRGYDLSTRPGRAATAKQLIGFANREIAAAMRHAEGYGYVLLGVEPGRLEGMPEHDSADIENWLSQYVQPELRYDVHPVEVNGTNVLMFVIDPPKQGDPIFALQRESTDPSGRTLPEGAIYVRRTGQTGVANAADIRRLTARSQQVGTELELRIDVDDSHARAISERLLADEVRDKYLSERRERLLSEVPEPDPILGFRLAALAGGDSRDVDEFHQEVDRFVELATKRWPTLVAFDGLHSDPPTVVFSVVNDSDENYEDVVVELRLPVGRAALHTTVAAAREVLKPPEEPARWGTSYAERAFRNIEPAVERGDFTDVERVEEMSTLVRFPPIHVRPRTRHPLPALLLTLPPAYGGQEVPVQWRVTARNTKGDLSGTVCVRIADPDDAAPDA